MSCTYSRCKIVLYMQLPATIRAFYLANTVTRDVVCITIHSNDTSNNKHCMLYNGTPLNISQHTHKKKYWQNLTMFQPCPQTIYQKEKIWLFWIISAHKQTKRGPIALVIKSTLMNKNSSWETYRHHLKTGTNSPTEGYFSVCERKFVLYFWSTFVSIQGLSLLGATCLLEHFYSHLHLPSFKLNLMEKAASVLLQ